MRWKRAAEKTCWGIRIRKGETRFEYIPPINFEAGREVVEGEVSTIRVDMEITG